MAEVKAKKKKKKKAKKAATAKKAKKSISDERVMVGMSSGQFRFVGGVAKKLKTTPTDAMRQLIQFARKTDTFKDFLKAEQELRK